MTSQASGAWVTAANGRGVACGQALEEHANQGGSGGSCERCTSQAGGACPLAVVLVGWWDAIAVMATRGRGMPSASGKEVDVNMMGRLGAHAAGGRAAPSNHARKGLSGVVSLGIVVSEQGPVLTCVVW
jgi:hypothetical protein